MSSKMANNFEHHSLVLLQMKKGPSKGPMHAFQEQSVRQIH